MSNTSDNKHWWCDCGCNLSPTCLKVNCNASHSSSRVCVLTSLYPLGMVPEISSVDVRQPAGQYLLKRRERYGERG